MVKFPPEVAFQTIENIMHVGSAKDGCNESWRDKDPMYHLSKAMNHLATHIKQIYDPRAANGENHLHLAITRLAMALSQDTPAKSSKDSITL